MGGNANMEQLKGMMVCCTRFCLLRRRVAAPLQSCVVCQVNLKDAKIMA